MSEIAITGVSGRVASCKNLEEFKNALLGGIDMVTHNHTRWNHKFLKTPNSVAIMEGLEYFDAAFFGLPPNQANGRDPRTRQLLEIAVESIFDAGINPQDLRGSNTGVILAIGEHFVDGLDRYMGVIANTISFCLDLKGPSYAVNTGCSSSVYALNAAVEAMNFGSCDSVLVCTAQTQLQPGDAIDLNKWGVLSEDGYCKSFDDDRNGYVKGEAIVSLLLQKQENAKRIYATIAGIGCNIDGYKVDGMTNPCVESQFNLLTNIYTKFNINPDDVEFMDAHGTGTLIGDLKECGAIAKFFNQNKRKQPLKLGSVKTNAGHSENAAGMVSLVKLLLAVNTGVIPGNNNFKTPALDIQSVESGEIEVVGKPTKYNGGLLALNSFGIGCANGHVVIRPFLNTNTQIADPNKPRLVLASGRTQEAVNHLLKQVEDNKQDLAFLSLLDRIFEKPISNHPYKGYKVLHRTSRLVQQVSNNKPIWFTFSGMGSQWFGMAKDLMQFSIFKESIEKTAKVLKRFNIDLKYLLTDGTEDDFDDPENCFPAITAMSVALTDMVYSIGIKPEGIIGHSLGEIGCAYADGLLTPEEAVLVAHARGIATKNTKLIPGLMAAVGLSFQECKEMLPEDIFIACDNSQQSVTISGPKESIENFVEHLKNKNIFAKIVNTAGIAFHSKYIHDAGPELLSRLKEIIPLPKRRSNKWHPSAIPRSEYSSYLGLFNSAEYHYYNFMNPVRYREVLNTVPENVVLLEIAPRGLFQAIFKRALPANITKIDLINKDVKDNGDYFLAAIGTLCLSTSISINLSSINKTVFGPADGRTTMISSMIKWDHSSKWSVPKYIQDHYDGETISINLKNIKNKYMYGCMVHETPVFSSAGYLFLAWKALANKHEKDMLELPVKMKEVHILRGVVLKDNLEFKVNILKSGNFEILEHGEVVAEGNISILEHSENICEHSTGAEEHLLEDDSFHEEFYLRGYNHVDTITAVNSLNVSGTSAKIKWLQNWISFMDAMVKILTFVRYSSLSVSCEFKEVKIDPILHQSLATKDKNSLDYHYNAKRNVATCGGVVLKGLSSTLVHHKPEIQKPILNQSQFVFNTLQYNEDEGGYLEFSLSIALQIVIENNNESLSTSIVQLEDGLSKSLKDTILHHLHKKFHKNAKFTTITDLSQLQSKVNLIILPLEGKEIDQDTLKNIDHPTFIFGKIHSKNITNMNKNIVFRCSQNTNNYALVRKCIELPNKFNVIETNTNDFKWIKEVKKHIYQSDSKTLLISKTPVTGLIGFFNCLKEEMLTKDLRVFILDSSAEEFSINSSFYKSQIQKDLTINILKNGDWCTYRILPLLIFKDYDIKDVYLRQNGDKMDWVESSPYQYDQDVIPKYVSLTPSMNRKHKYKNLFSLPHDKYLGYEFAGVGKFGQNVIGISMDGCLRTSLKPMLSWPVPYNVNIEEFSTLPLDYSLAYCALFLRGKLQANEMILIVGKDTTALAAAVLAIEHNCQVIIEVDEPEDISKIDTFLSNNKDVKYVCKDQLKESGHECIKCVSLNDEVDAIFFSESQYLHSYHMDIVSKNGRLLTIYRDDNYFKPETLQVVHQKHCQIHQVDLTTISKKDTVLLQSSIQNYLNTKTLKPFLYDIKDTKEVLSLDAIENSIDSKVIVKMDQKDIIDRNTTSRQIYYHPAKSYIVIGGLGTVGLQLVKWLVRHGAKNIVINSRRSVESGYAQYLFKRMRCKGITIIHNNYNAKNESEAEQLIQEASTLGPVGGIFNLAMVLKEVMFENSTPDDFEEVVGPKLYISQNLDVISRRLCPKLEHFVVFSAIAALGAESLSSYGFANSAVEQLCKERKSLGLPALAVQWGFLGEVNSYTNQKLNKQQRENMQSIYSCLKTLEKFMLKNGGVFSSSLCSDSKGNVESSVNSLGLLDHIANIMGVSDIYNLDKNVALSCLGLDSISALEIKNLLEDNLDINLSTREVRKLTLNEVCQMNDSHKTV